MLLTCLEILRGNDAEGKGRKGGVLGAKVGVSVRFAVALVLEKFFDPACYVSSD